jgi:hypothetical protein
MKKIVNLLMITLTAMSVSSCKKYLDVNTNPNQAVSATPDLVLPQSIVAVANQTWAYNFYGAQVGGYLANGGGVSGWGSIISYNYQSTDQQGLWNNTYNIANDIQTVINTTEGQPAFVQFNAAAKVMKAFAFQRLVDQYGDIPYTQALQGASNVTPAYDKADAVYKNLADLCDQAITAFKANTTPASTFRTADPLFNSSSATTEINRWIQFAQTIKLRLIIRAQGKVQFTNTNFDTTIGFLTDDAIVQPGYQKITGKQNPFWNSFAYTVANAVSAGATQYAPTPWIMSFYNGNKLTDPARAIATYKVVTPTTVSTGATTATKYPVATNQLGYQLADAGRGATPNSWFKGTNATAYDQLGIFKGPDAGQVIFLAADSYFLQAEAALRGLISGTPKTLFDQGIVASYNYLYKNAAGAVPAGRNATADAIAYRAANVTAPKPYLTNYDLATSDAQRLEAIITQKYIALNMIIGDEAWNEYRRTGYPAVTTSATPQPLETFASLVSEATAADRLPARLLYPNSEFVYNATNVPSVNKYTTKIFWAR